MTFNGFIDSNNNRVCVCETGRLAADGCPLLVVRLADDLDTGYIAAVTGEGGFGDEACPSSYNRPCCCWFGPEERFPNAQAALEAAAG